jgi:hypothetical protein
MASQRNSKRKKIYSNNSCRKDGLKRKFCVGKNVELNGFKRGNKI